MVFTGELSGLSREEAMQGVADVGGICANNITKRTTMLVIGHSDKSVGQVEISTGSGKERKALQYVAAGQEIQAVTEKQFIGWINSGGGAEDRRSASVTQSVPPTANRPASTNKSEDAPETTLLVETAISGLFKLIRGIRSGK
ncbi:BRCT domain-containing protein [Arthrobacter sp. AET 35A]|uniref:BRCT domain-containing protein n=1 Tax=Arthrobacter sp. AET 35A TaxID=2292643 RepID=UPI001CE24CB8|nr:BRCT domain-containing protein [Arthrobacter sp. AET 35A]